MSSMKEIKNISEVKSSGKEDLTYTTFKEPNALKRSMYTSWKAA